MKYGRSSFLFGVMLCLASCAYVEGVIGQKPIKSIVDGIDGTLVQTPEEFDLAVERARPGDQIVLANGIWKDFDAVFDVEGTSEEPIILKAQTAGQVFLTGQSSLRLAGKHMVVSGFYFKDGYTPRNEVISFRRDKERLAHNARVTNTVIKNYSNPDRSQRDIWVAMYGRNNEFDHNHLEGKLNSGPTMVIRLNTKESQENNHHVHHNYFGPRPVLGSNGGETFRIGTSHYSLTSSNTLVENNYFDRCSGEVEIISNKSGGNIYRNNTFFQSRGTLTLRHGNGTLVESNLFDGNGAPYTGGVRVINAQQSIKDNYFKNLTGTRFSGALVVMNGVPNSPINRYHQVDGASIKGNVFENVASIELGEGSDAERSAIPVNSVFSENFVFNETGETPFRLYDDMSGIEFSSNKANTDPPKALASGFDVSQNFDETHDGRSYGVNLNDVGTNWHPKRLDPIGLDSGKDILVSPGENAIAKAVKSANPGDRLILEAGSYAEATTIDVSMPLSIEAKEGAEGKVTLSFERKNMFVLSGKGSLRLAGLTVSGTSSPDNVGNSFITTSTLAGSNHTLIIEDTDFVDFTVNRSFSIVTAAKGTLFDKIKITNSSFKNVSGSAVKLIAETDDYGMYNVEFLEIENSTFENMVRPAVDVYRGGRDESTFGPSIDIGQSIFDKVATSGGPAVNLHGVQSLSLNDNTIENSEPFLFTITTGKPKMEVEGNVLVGSESVSVLDIEDLRK